MLFELGFKETLNTILESLPTEKQVLFFSATLGRNVHELGKKLMKNPEYIFLHDPKNKK